MCALYDRWRRWYASYETTVGNEQFQFRCLACKSIADGSNNLNQQSEIGNLKSPEAEPGHRHHHGQTAATHEVVDRL